MSEDLFYSCEFMPESIHHENKNDSIRQYLEDAYWHGPYPKVVQLTTFTRMKIPDNFLEGAVLEFCIERLDEEFGDPEAGTYTKPSKTMKEAEAEFAKAICSKYVVWNMEEKCREWIDVHDWIEKNTDWIARYKKIKLETDEVCKECSGVGWVVSEKYPEYEKVCSKCGGFGSRLPGYRDENP